MPSTLAENFMEALKRTEADRDAAPVVAFFGDGAELRRLDFETQRGREGAEAFWRDYLDSFSEQTTTFHDVTETDDTVVLEWTSEGTLPNGRPLRYSGVSLLERDGDADDRVAAFRTYYDSAAFVEVHAT